MEKLHDKMTEIKNMTEKLYKLSKNKSSSVFRNSKDEIESISEHMKDSVSDLYDEGKHKIHVLEDCIEEYSDEIIKKVKENPVTSILIIGGIGYLLMKLLKNKDSK